MKYPRQRGVLGTEALSNFSVAFDFEPRKEMFMTRGRDRFQDCPFLFLFLAFLFSPSTHLHSTLVFIFSSFSSLCVVLLMYLRVRPPKHLSTSVGGGEIDFGEVTFRNSWSRDCDLPELEEEHDSPPYRHPYRQRDQACQIEKCNPWSNMNFDRLVSLAGRYSTGVLLTSKLFSDGF